MAPHRWAWMVANGRAANPLLGSLFQVWRHCETSKCCNPEHLYLVDPDGEESSAEEAEEWLRFVATEQPDTAGADRSQRHSGDFYSSSFPTADSPQVISTGGRHRASAYDSATPSSVEYSTGRKTREIKLFADRLNALFETRRESEGAPCTSADVAAALQDDGLAVSESLISRLREASGAMPSAQTIEALSYFFNVDVDYFSAGTHSVAVSEPRPLARAQPRLDRESRPTPRQTAPPEELQVVPISVADLGRIVTGLSQAASECLARSPADIERGGRLLTLVADMGALLSTPMDRRVISRPLLRRIVKEWRSVGHATHVRHPILAHLTQLVGGEPDPNTLR